MTQSRHPKSGEVAGNPPGERLPASVVHDLNNLLTVICGNCELALTHCALTPDLRSMLEEAHGAARRAAELTSELLKASRRS